MIIIIIEDKKIKELVLEKNKKNHLFNFFEKSESESLNKNSKV